MTRFRSALILGLAVVGLAAWSLRAQERPKRAAPEPAPEASSRLRPAGPAPSVQEAMLRPFDLPFGEGITLEALTQHLRRALGAPVVLDLGALERQELR